MKTQTVRWLGIVFAGCILGCGEKEKLTPPWSEMGLPLPHEFVTFHRSNPEGFSVVVAGEVDRLVLGMDLALKSQGFRPMNDRPNEDTSQFTARYRKGGGNPLYLTVTKYAADHKRGVLVSASYK